MFVHNVYKYIYKHKQTKHHGNVNIRVCAFAKYTYTVYTIILYSYKAYVMLIYIKPALQSYLLLSSNEYM